MAKKYTSDDVVLFLNLIVAELNSKYSTNIELFLDSSLNFVDTCFSPLYSRIFLGTKDIELFPEINHPRLFSESELITISQYVVHEFFHGEQERRILTNPTLDIQLTADYILSYIFHSFYEENHTLSLLEIDVERKSWKFLSEKLPQYLNISQAKADRILCSIFASEKNEFFKYSDHTIVDNFFMNLPGATHEDLDSFLQSLDAKSRTTLRDTPERLAGYFDFSDCKNVCDQVNKISKNLNSFQTTNVEIVKARIALDEINTFFPDLLGKIEKYKDQTRAKEEHELEP